MTDVLCQHVCGTQIGPLGACQVLQAKSTFLVLACVLTWSTILPA